MAMGFLAGTNVLVAVRLLGFPREVPIPAMERLFPVMWLAFWVNLVTGILLVMGLSLLFGTIGYSTCA